jgi:metal-responsive CopG/Arc/MetJ family transcriptional regulator
MAVDKDRELIQVNIRLYKDQLARLDRIWKLKELDSRSELIRMQLDKLFEEEKEILKGL